MSTSAERPRTNRLVRWAALGLLGVFAALTAFYFFRENPDYSDAAKVQELQSAALTSNSAAADDWPQWRGPNRDGISSATGLLTEWPEDLMTKRKVWEQPVGPGYSSVAVAGGRAYTLFQEGDNEAVVCWDAEKGQELWRFRYPAKFQESHGNGPRSTPTVEGEHVYTVGATGRMHCLKTQPSSTGGEVVWHRDLLAEFGGSNLIWGVSFSPLIEKELIYVMPGGPGACIAALDKSDGRTKWKALDDPASYSSPMAGTLAGKRQIVFFTGSAAVGVGPEDGALYWRIPWETFNGINAATPILVNDYVFISAGYHKGCAVVKIEADAAGTQRARLVYRNTRMQNQFSTSVRQGDQLYGFNDKILTCMDFRTGKVCWTERAFETGSLLAADGHLIVLGQDGTLGLVLPKPEEYVQKASVRFSERTPCWAMPTLANGRLYLRDDQKVVCLDLRQEKGRDSLGKKEAHP